MLFILKNKYKLDEKILEIYDTYKSYFNKG
jgi:hypothetical protein